MTARAGFSRPPLNPALGWIENRRKIREALLDRLEAYLQTMDAETSKIERKK